MPASTSPVPAFANAGVPCAMRTVCSPSERYVTGPFTTATTP